MTSVTGAGFVYMVRLYRTTILYGGPLIQCIRIVDTVQVILGMQITHVVWMRHAQLQQFPTGSISGWYVPASHI